MTDNNIKNRGFLKDSSIYLSGTVISFVIGFISLPIYTRFLSPADYGIIALFMMFGLVSTGLLSFGLQSASYRYYFKYKDNIEKYKILNSSILIFLFLVFLFSGFGIYFLADWLSATLFDGKITGKLLCWSFLGGCMEYLFTYFTFILTAQLRSLTFSLITISRAIIRLLITLYFIFVHSLTYLAWIYSLLLTQGILIVCLLILTGNLLVLRFSSSSFKETFKFSYPTVLRQIIGLINKSFDKIMLINYSGLDSIGYYSFGQKFAYILKMLIDSIGKVWSPYFQNKAHEKTKEAKRAIVRRFLELSFLYMLIGFSIICFSEEMIKLLTTKEFYPAMYVVPIYVYYYMFGIMGTLSINQIQYSEKTLYMLPASIVGVIINITLNILLIPIFGVFGAVIALAINGLLGNLVHLYFGSRLYPLPLKYTTLACMFLITLVFTVPIYPIMAADMHFLIKITIKLFIILLFIITGLKLNYIHKENIRLIVSILFPLPILRSTNQKI